MAKKRPTKQEDQVGEVESLKRVVGQYEEVFNEISKFTAIISEQEAEIHEAEVKEKEAAAAHLEAKRLVNELKSYRDGTKHSLYRFLRPGLKEIYPLFDKMEPADDKQHGNNARKWRRDPLSALRISLPAIAALNDADILMVGQLQDRVIDDEDWWMSVPGLTVATAAAIVDRLNDFIFEQGKK